MTFTTWGQTATHSTTVSASPTPTTTSCTVASVGSFREGMAVYFDVSGTPERTFLTGITGNALTFSPALSGAPDVGGDAVSYHQPIFNDKLNESALWREATKASLRAVDTTGMPDGTRVIVEDIGVYRLDTAGSGADDNHKIIDPTTGPGRWFLEVFGPAWVRDTNWISSFPTADGNNYQYLGTNGAGAISFQSLPAGPQKFTQASHGFAAKDVIRHTGTAWTKAQGNTIPNSTGVWLVLSVSGDDFFAIQQGRISLASHGLSAGTLYYLDPSTAGLLTATKPVGTSSQPLGFFLPVVYVESSSVLHVLGQPIPSFNPLLAEYVNTSGSDVNTVTFSNLDLDAYGGQIRFELGMAQQTNGGVAVIRCRINGLSGSNYSHWHNYDNLSAWARAATTGQNYWEVGYNPGVSGSDNQMSVDGFISLPQINGTATNPHFTSNWVTSTANGISRGRYTSTVTNITSIQFGDISGGGDYRFRANSNHYARLFWDTNGLL